MPVCIGMTGGQSISVLRHTRCWTVVVKRESVNNEQMTGETESCILFDGTVRTTVAEIEIKTPYYSARVKSVCMENPLYDVIIGNVPGMSNESSDAMEVQAVVTE